MYMFNFIYTYMIVSEYVEINVNNANKKHFQALGYDITRKILTVPIEHLTSGSHSKIVVSCDKCGAEKTKVYGDYLKNFNNGNLYVCKDCQQFKTEKTNLLKYGFKCASQNKKTKEKATETNLERYGFICSSKNEEVKNKIKQTNLDKYGGTLLGSQIIKEKTKETLIKKYGVEHISQNEEIKRRVKQIHQQKYGGMLLASKLLKEKSKQIMLERYGVENPAQNLEMQNKRSETALRLKRYKQTNLTYQGSYELDFLNRYFDKIEIENGSTIRYKYENKNKVYYPDFFIPAYNLIVEIKSSWWYNRFLEKNLLKENQCLKNGYQFIFIINKNYDDFEKLINYK